MEQYIKDLDIITSKSVSGEKCQSEMIFKVTIIASVVARSQEDELANSCQIHPHAGLSAISTLLCS